MIMIVLMSSVTVIMATTEIRCDNFFNQEEANNTSNDNKICQHLLRIMGMTLVPVTVYMIMIIMIVLMGMIMRVTRS